MRMVEVVVEEEFRSRGGTLERVPAESLDLLKGVAEMYGVSLHVIGLPGTSFHTRDDDPLYRVQVRKIEPGQIGVMWEAGDKPTRENFRFWRTTDNVIRHFSPKL